MTRMKVFALASCVGLFGAALAPTVLADEWNKRTILTVNEPMQVPNKVLQPGKYVMRLLDSPSNRHIVQIFDENDQHLITTVLAIPNYRLQPTGETQFGFWETPAGQPKALRSWFYPGDNFGQEFAYPKNEAMTIAASNNTAVPTTYAQSEADLTTAKVGTVDQTGTEREMPQETAPTGTMAQATPPAPAAEPMAERAATPAPAPEPQATPATPASPAATSTDAPAATPAEMPHTASPYPLVALMGLFSIAVYGGLRVAAKRLS